MKIIDEIPPELLDAVNKFSKELEWSRRLPIYEVHKWWARRYSGIIRLFLAFTELDKNILGKVDDFYAFVKKVYFYPPRVNNKKLLDPFCGGGTIIIEGKRLGYDTYGIEINKLPYLILNSLKLLPHLNLEFLKKKIINIADCLTYIWETTCVEGHPALIIHTFLAWKDREGNLQIKLNKLRDGKEKTYFCEKCKKIFVSTREMKKCQVCGNQFDKNLKRIEHKRLVPYAIEYYCPICGQRAFKIVSPEDEKKFNIEFRWKLFDIPLLNETRRLLNTGFKHFGELLTPRQQLTFYKFLSSFKNEPYRTIAKLLVSDSLRSCSLLAYYSAKYRKTIPGFVIKSYWLPFQPVELNPLSYRFSKNGEMLPLGRGNIISGFRKIKRAKKFIINQQLPLDFKVFHGPAQDIIPKLNYTFDVIFTDPPYGDYQFYSDLSLFSLSVLNEIDHGSLRELLEKEIVIRKKEDLIKYKKKLFIVFNSALSKLSKKGRLIMTFHHPDINILREVLDVFKILSINLHAVYPVIGESSGRLVKRRLYLDLIFVFGRERRTPYCTLTNYCFTKWDKQLQRYIDSLIQFYEE